MFAFATETVGAATSGSRLLERAPKLVCAAVATVLLPPLEKKKKAFPFCFPNSHQCLSLAEPNGKSVETGI